MPLCDGWVYNVLEIQGNKKIQWSTRLLHDSDVEGYYVFNDEVTIHSKGPVLGSYVFKDNCTYKVKWKPLFDGWVLGVRNI